MPDRVAQMGRMGGSEGRGFAGAAGLHGAFLKLMPDEIDEESRVMEQPSRRVVDNPERP